MTTLSATAQPAAFYTAPDVFAAELTHIHLRSWFFVGLAGEIPDPGDYRAIETVGGPVILVRDEQGRAGAFANVCRHRGSLLLSGAGHARAIRCPYHAWAYRLDGSLLVAPAMDHTVDFNPAAHSLVSIRLQEWNGLLFLNFDPQAADLRETLGNLPDTLGCYHFQDMVCTWRHEIACNCNWKLLVENALEAYHTGTVHAATVGPQREAIIPTRGDWLCLQVLSTTSVAVLTDAPPFPQIETLDDQARRGTYFTMILPVSQLACAQDCMWWLAVRPVAADRSVVSLGGCFPRTTTERPDFARHAAAYYDRWRRVAEEDVGILEKQQHAFSSVRYTPGRLSWRDELPYAVQSWVRARLPYG